MGYRGFMAYGYQITANQVEKHEIVWGIRGYGVMGLWVMRGSTVVIREADKVFATVCT